MALDDTIAGIATPPGEGGIGIIRISGNNALQILRALFRRGGKKLYEVDYSKHPRELLYGYIVDSDSGETVDEVLAVYMPKPSTYTAEDVAEIDCHGGPVSLSRVLSLVYAEGARPAEPGEFTKRAFLNGRVDLSQAEAVMDLVSAKTEVSSKLALNQLQGKFSAQIKDLRAGLTDVLVDVAVNIDYPDEDIEEITYKKLKDDLCSIDQKIKQLLSGAREGRILKDGIRVAIVGEPNVGKSSLMNALLRHSRAIVTEIPGTTRDTIEDYANIRGLPVRLTDTAGIRETDDLIEKLGIERSRESVENADIVILMVDLSKEDQFEALKLLDRLDNKKTLVVFNKSDKEFSFNESDMKKIAGDSRYIVSSLTEEKEESIDKVEDAIYKMVLGDFSAEKDRDQANKSYDQIDRSANGPGKVEETYAVERSARSVVVTNARHEAALRRAEKSLSSAIQAVEKGMPLEIIDIDLKDAYTELGFITGDSVQADIIDEIFSRFCLGK